jgi:hypothetical protein
MSAAFVPTHLIDVIMAITEIAAKFDILLPVLRLRRP